MPDFVELNLLSGDTVAIKINSILGFAISIDPDPEYSVSFEGPSAVFDLKITKECYNKLFRLLVRSELSWIENKEGTPQ